MENAVSGATALHEHGSVIAKKIEVNRGWTVVCHPWQPDKGGIALPFTIRIPGKRGERDLVVQFDARAVEDHLTNPDIASYNRGRITGHIEAQGISFETFAPSVEDESSSP